MPTQEFEATKGLLHDDMRKQAGRIEKSWLEAVMNAVDAGADEFEIFISALTTEMIDNGGGMGNHEINNYFQKFGYKDDDVGEKTYGKFRRGRGQIFNFGKNIWHTQDNILVVDLDHKQTTVEVPLDVDPQDDDVIEVNGDEIVLNTEGNSFNWQDAQEYRDGTRIFVEHYKEIEDVGDKVREFKKLVRYISWMHDIDIYVNDEQVDNTFKADFETEYAYFQYGESSMFPDAATYNLGAYVDGIKVKDSNGQKVPVSGVIISKKELDLNNARTEIIEGDDVWEQIKEDYIVGARYNLAERSDLGSSEVKWLIKQSKNDEEIFETIKDRDILQDIDGNGVALSELKDTNFAFAPEGNAVAQEAMDRGDVLMVHEKYENAVRHLAGEEDNDGPVDKGKSYEEVIEEDMGFEMKERDESKLSKRRKENINKIRWLLREIGCYDEVKPGFSKHEDVWRPDRKTILVDEDFLNSNKMKFATEVVDKVVEIAAANCDTRRGFNKGGSYKRDYYKYMSKVTEPRKKLLQGREDISSVPQLR